MLIRNWNWSQARRGRQASLGGGPWAPRTGSSYEEAGKARGPCPVQWEEDSGGWRRPSAAKCPPAALWAFLRRSWKLK